MHGGLVNVLDYFASGPAPLAPGGLFLQNLSFFFGATLHTFLLCMLA